MKQTLDFLVIGAQKSGTTALFHLLREHPQLFLPAAKEIPFFSTPEFLPERFPDFLRNFYSRTSSDLRWGKASPQYMAHPEAASRIATLLPACRLIAILRDPVERAISHYRMLARRGRTSAPLEPTLMRLMEPGAASRARKLPSGPESEPDCLLAWGEYGRILTHYLDYFQRSHILIIFTPELRSDPDKVLKRIWHFLEVSGSFSPSNLGREFHVGGAAERMPWLGRLMRSNARKLGAALLPASLRKTLSFRLRQFNVLPDAAPAPTLTADLRSRLVNFYSRDTRQLEAAFGLTVPWEKTSERI